MRFLAGAILAALTLNAWAWSSRVEAPRVGSDWEPADPAVQAAVERQVEGAGRWVDRQVESLGVALPPGLRMAFYRLMVLGQAAWVFALAASASVFAGLYVRESAREALRFSSPTWNYLGKRLAAAAAVAGGAAPLLPWPIPAWIPYLCGLAFAIGVAAYVANLPVKL